MKKTSLLLIVSAFALATAAVSAQAATPAAAPMAATAPAPVTPPSFGAPVPGECVLDTQQAMGNSAMGKAASDRLVQLKAMVDSELSPEGTALETEYKTLAAQQKASSATAAGKAAWEQKAQGWSEKRDAFQRKVQLRQQEMQATQQEVLQAIFQKMIPQINAVVTQKSCSSVVSADSLLHYDTTSNTGGAPVQSSFVYVNPAMDITTAVVAKLDSSGEFLPPFDRAHLDQQQGAPTGK